MECKCKSCPEHNGSYKQRGRKKVLTEEQKKVWFCKLCDVTISRQNKTTHEKTKKHMKKLTTKSD